MNFTIMNCANTVKHRLKAFYNISEYKESEKWSSKKQNVLSLVKIAKRIKAPHGLISVKIM